MIVSIQYLRGLAAFLVLLNHVAWKSQQHGRHALDGFNIGECGVDIFFVISGFIMCHVTSGGRVAIAGFVRNRLLRILPLYWILTTVALGAFLLMPGRVNSSGGSTHVLASYLLLPTEGKFLIEAGWTLSYELLFYGLFAGGLLLSGWTGRAWVAGALVVLASLRAWHPLTHPVAAFLTSDLLLEFTYGIGLYWLFLRNPLQRGWSAALVGAIGVALFAAANASPDRHFLSPVRAFNYGVPAFLVCWGTVSLERQIARHKVRWLELLGDASYSLYLSHVFSIGAFAVIAGGIPGSGPWVDLPMAALMVTAALAGGLLCYRWIEQPARWAVKFGFGTRVPEPHPCSTART